MSIFKALITLNLTTLKSQALIYLDWLKKWLEPANLAQLRPKLEFQTGVLAGFGLARAKNALKRYSAIMPAYAEKAN